MVFTDKIDKVLDLTNPNVLKQLDVSTESITKNIAKQTDAYDITQVIGHIAKAKGFKGIIAPSAHEGKNFISFKELE